MADDMKTWIKEKAQEVWLAIKGGQDVDAIYQALLSAVMRERERCAVIVESEGSCRHVDHAQGFCACADKAAAIRTAETPDGE